MVTTSTFAESPGENDSLTALRALKIDAGTIVSVARETGPLPGAEGQPPRDIPPRTVVKLVLNPAKGSNINVEIWLPDREKWNGRFLGLGNGGSAGYINTGALAGGLAEGYAVANTDMGTTPSPDSGNGNPEVWKDFGFRATHLMTVAAKQCVKAFYGKDLDYSYFLGGSTGGQQAFQEAQRYPEDYDGIVANIPAQCRTPLHAYFLWNDQILHQCPFTESQEKSVIAAGNEYMAPRETPATAGKIVSDPRCDSKDVEAVIQLAMKKAPTLTQVHAAALRQLFDGPRHAVTGERIFGGIPFGASFDNAHGNLYLFHWVFGAKKDLMELNFGADIDQYIAALGPYLNAENPDLGPFEKRGGKLISTTGTADACTPYYAILDYYERVVARFGGIEKVRSFFRLYVVPGMGHGGGPGIDTVDDTLSLVIAWREKGIAPEAIRGRRIIEWKTELDMPLYPYPTKTGWDAVTAAYIPVEGPRGGVPRVAERFLPAAGE